MVFNTLGREWMKQIIKNTLGVEITMMVSSNKRSREDLEESQNVITMLPGPEFVHLQKSLESLPFSTVLAQANDNVKAALRRCDDRQPSLWKSV